MNWIKVNNDAPAVLRALADGKKARWALWGDGRFIHLRPDGAIRDEIGRVYDAGAFGGTWLIEPDRDIATSPQAGDEFMEASYKCRVRVVHDGVVVYAFDDGGLNAVPLDEWTELWADESFTRAKRPKSNGSPTAAKAQTRPNGQTISAWREFPEVQG